MKIKTNLFIGIGAALAVAAPIATVVACNKKANNDIKEISLNFGGNDASKLLAAKTFKDDFYDAKIKSTDYKSYKVNVTLPTGGPYEITLSPTDFAEVQQGVVDTDPNNISFSEFIDTMKSSTGTTHQYSYAKSDAVKLGVDGITDNHDEAFQKTWLMNNLIHEMPDGVTIDKIVAHKITNNIVVTFKNGTATEDADFHLKSAKSQADADKTNASGGSWFYKAYKAIATPLKKVIGEIKTLAHFGNLNNQITEKQFFTNVAKTAADAFVDKVGELIPVYGEITKIPLIGPKVQDFVHTHAIEPMVDVVATKI